MAAPHEQETGYVTRMPTISSETLISMFSENDPASAVDLLKKEQPTLVEVIELGWPEYEVEGAVWAAALCYAAIKRESEATELQKIMEAPGSQRSDRIAQSVGYPEDG